MYITKIEIYNFRNHKNTTVDFSKNTVLIGKNNAGKTSLLEALRFALDRTGKRLPVEDDFYTKDIFSPQNIEPITIKIEFKESPNERFSENILSDFNGIWLFDNSTKHLYETPLRFIKITYKCKYDFQTKETNVERYFENNEGKKIESKDLQVNESRTSYFPFFYLDALRNIHNEINHKKSFWGKLKKDIEYDETTQQELKTQIGIINDLLLGHKKIDVLKKELGLLQKNLNQSTGELYLQAFSKRNWELLDQLDIFIKSRGTDFGLPVSKHGSGTQNLATFIIFKAYINILLPELVDNEEAFPIIAIEEPEAHIHPQAQRELFEEISKLNGQKIISTHSPFIAEQAEIYDYIFLKNENGISTARKIKQFKTELKEGLPKEAYKANKYLSDHDEHLIKRYVQSKHPELFFSNLFILCEGDSEKILIENLFPYHIEKITEKENITVGKLGISVINCDGKNYSPFLKIAKELDLKWFIFSDGETDTMKEVKNQIQNAEFDYQQVKSNIIFLENNFDTEKYYIDFYGVDKIEEFINSNYKQSYKNFIGNLKNNLNDKDEIKNYSKDVLFNKLIDSIGKPRIAEKLSEFIIEKKLDIPAKFKELIDNAYKTLTL